MSDCPICMECIEVNKNCVTTDCGHQFHASCLMKSVAHNGFGCPYCRTKMADEPEYDDDSEEGSEEDNSEYDSEYDSEFDDSNSYIMRGARFFWNRQNGEPHDSQDVDDEEQDEQNEYHDVPVEYVVQKMREVGVTYDKLVESILGDILPNRYSSSNSITLTMAMHDIVLGYRPQNEVTPSSSYLDFDDYDAQPKNFKRAHDMNAMEVVM